VVAGEARPDGRRSVDLVDGTGRRSARNTTVSAVTTRFEPQQTHPGRPAGRRNPPCPLFSLARPTSLSLRLPHPTTSRPPVVYDTPHRPRYIPCTTTSPPVTTSSVSSRHHLVRSLSSTHLDTGGTRSRGTVPRTGRESERNSKMGEGTLTPLCPLFSRREGGWGSTAVLSSTLN
jgi:hypothetical protein